MNTTNVKAMPRDLNIENRKLILDFMKDGQPHSVAEISATLKISRQTVKKKLDFFSSKQLVISRGKGSSTDFGGKRPEIFAMNPNIYFLCSFQIYNLVICTALFNFSGTLMDQCVIPHEETYSLEDYVNIIVTGIRTLMSRGNIPPENIHEFLVGNNGLVDSKEGIIRKTTTTPHWGEDIPLKKMLEDRLAEIPRIRVVNLIALVSAHVLANPQMDSSRIIVLYWGSGISMRMIDRGHFSYTDSPICGEIENMVIDFSNYKGQHREEKACFRHIISEEKIGELFSRLSPEQQSAILGFRDSSEIKHDLHLAVFQAADNGNPEAKKLVEYMADVFFAVLMNMAVCFDPQYVVFNGLPRQYHKCFEERIYLNFQDFLYFRDVKQQMKLVFQLEDLFEICLAGSHYLMQKQFLEHSSLYEDS